MSLRRYLQESLVVGLVMAVAIAPVHGEEAAAKEAPVTNAPTEAAAPAAPEPRALRGLRPGETPVQQRERLLKDLEVQTGELTAAQKDGIRALYIKAADELYEARQDKSLDEEQQLGAARRIRTEMLSNIDALLTEAQRERQKRIIAEQDENARNPDHNGGLQPGETLSQRRERLLLPYETTLTDLTTQQKLDLLTILEPADDIIAAARRDDSRSEEKRAKVIARVQQGVANKVEKLLTKPQLEKWQKAEALRAKSAEAKPAAKAKNKD